MKTDTFDFRALTGRIQDFVRDDALWSEGASLLVAVSGGPDSVALLDLLQAGFAGEMLAVAHVNHLLRPEAGRRKSSWRRWQRRTGCLSSLAASMFRRAWRTRGNRWRRRRARCAMPRWAKWRARQRPPASPPGTPPMTRRKPYSCTCCAAPAPPGRASARTGQHRAPVAAGVAAGNPCLSRGARIVLSPRSLQMSPPTSCATACAWSCCRCWRRRCTPPARAPGATGRLAAPG